MEGPESAKQPVATGSPERWDHGALSHPVDNRAQDMRTSQGTAREAGADDAGRKEETAEVGVLAMGTQARKRLHSVTMVAAALFMLPFAVLQITSGSETPEVAYPGAWRAQLGFILFGLVMSFYANTLGEERLRVGPASAKQLAVTVAIVSLLELAQGMDFSPLGFLLISTLLGLGLHFATSVERPKKAAEDATAAAARSGADPPRSSPPLSTYGRFEVLSGYINAVFLVLVAALIVVESIERMLDPPSISTEHLLMVSLGGLLVNVIGLVFFHEAHHAAHGGACSHGAGAHDHDHPHPHSHDHSPLHEHSHSHHHEHEHKHGHSHSCEHSHEGHGGSGHAKIGCGSHASLEASPPPPLGSLKGPGYGQEDSPSSDNHHRSHSHSQSHSHTHFDSPSGDSHGHACHGSHLAPAHAHAHGQPAAGGSQGHLDDSPLGEGGDSHRQLEHGHGHGHQQGGHGHGHAHHSHPPALEETLTSGNAHMDHNMHGIFLHVLADTLGSVGVVISTLLIKYKGWLLTDPACSIFISLLIISTVIPLLVNSAEVILQRIPRAAEKTISTTLQQVERVDGVRGHQRAHFWSFTPRQLVGSLHVLAAGGADKQRIRRDVLDLFHSIGVAHMTVQVEDHEVGAGEDGEVNSYADITPRAHRYSARHSIG
eukprot:jgi/Mesen1/8376/ME000468S07812